MIDELRRLGLNRYEAAVYTALVRLGLSTSTKVSVESNVPYGRIYTVLQSLEKKGFVKIFGGRPKRFMAIEPRIIMNKVLDEKRKALEQNKREAGKIIRELETVAKSETESPLEAIRIIEGRKSYLNFSVKLHENAKKEWRSIHGLPFYKPHLEAYKKMTERGVNARILTRTSDAAKLDVWKKTGAHIRRISVAARFTVIDRKEVVLRISDPEVKGWVAIWIKSPALAATLADHFDKLWKTAVNV